ncbi:65-kDa microtubule-associated protein 6-like [Phragmites australis]|uniref:65-kDa microtubule-associated protein 6-like n=1 Tax=Phragmites australis TaxID=29695 RepID=UPI002D78DA37|nr:65-kDa microtubule-associated protein 6-like [Phragmites australis]XP_062193395.1 65-kDa microtubule-associated protein 6-like [Phragmites australis]
MVGTGAGLGLGMEATSCGALLRELQQLWAEVGESEGEKNKVLLEIERECLEVYRRKVDDANRTRVQLHQSVAAKEAEVASLIATLGEHKLYLKKDKGVVPLKEQLAAVVPVLENLKCKKEERIKQFSDILSQIAKIRFELSEYNDQGDNASSLAADEHDLSTRKINNYQAQLRALQKEKSERLHKVLEYIDEVHSLCGVLGIDFGKTVNEVHPSLHQNGVEKSRNISNSTLEGLASTISKLNAERKSRIYKMRETMESLCQLWKLMDSPEEEKRQFSKVMSILILPEEGITSPGVLSQEIIEKMEAEVRRLTKLKTSRLKDIVMKRRTELEDICRNAHIEPDVSTTPEQTNALVDSGLIDPSELLANIESQILKAKEESLSRKDIMDRINKWIAACDEEAWLEEYNQDPKRYSAGRGAHINLRRAEKARILVTKIPSMLDNLINRTFAWENARNKPFLYDGGRLISVLEEYRLSREQKAEEKRRYRDQKKLESILLAEKEAIFGSKSSPKMMNSLNRKINGYRSNGNSNGLKTATPRRSSLGSATPELLTPRSYSGHNRYFGNLRRLSATQLNFGDDSLSTFTSISGSEPESPSLG